MTFYKPLGCLLCRDGHLRPTSRRDPALSGSGPSSSMPAAASTATPETPTPRIAALVEKGRAKMGSLQTSDAKAGSKTTHAVSKRAKKEESDTRQKKPDVVAIDPEESSSYEYYSESAEPPTKKAKSSGSKKPEDLDKEGWKKRAKEVEKLLHKVTKENKKLRQQLADERASKSRKSRNLKRAVKSLLEAGSDTTEEADAK